MAATQVLSVAAGAATSNDIVVADGAHLTIGLNGVTNTGAHVVMEVKDPSGGYIYSGSELTSATPMATVVTPMTFRFRRLPTSSACGVFTA